MPLETLRSKTPPNIRRISVENESRIETPAQKLAELKKNSEIYDKKEGQWKEAADSDVPNYYNRKSVEQLIGAWAEIVGGKRNMVEKFEGLKDSKFYEDGKWRKAMDLNGKYDPEEGDYNEINRYLMAALLEALVNPEKGQKKLENLKWKYFNEENVLWFDSMPKSELEIDPIIAAEDQMIAILIGAQLNRNAAKKQWAALKKTELYKEEDDVWLGAMDLTGNSEGYFPFATNQLLAVIVEAQFNPEKAKEKVYELKNSSFYNENKKIWKASLDQTSENFLSTQEQLFGILAEYYCEKEIPDQIPPQPKNRQF